MNRNQLKVEMRKIFQEIKDDSELEEMTGTGAVAGYNTPAAFSADPTAAKKKNKRLAAVSGGEIVDEAKKSKKLKESDILNLKQEKPKPTAGKECEKCDQQIADISGMELTENRWLALKNEDGSPKQKVGKGVRNIKTQLAEIEKFVNWYGKIKNEGGLKKEDYWKRTQKHLNSIKERLMNLSDKIRTL